MGESVDRASFRSATPAAVTLLALAWLLLLPLMAHGTEGTQGVAGDETKPTNPEIQRLEEEKKKAELERDIAKARAEARREGLPKAETKPLEGKTTVDDKLVLPSQFLAYQSASKIAERAAQDILAARPETKRFVVYSEKDLGTVTSYSAVAAQIEALISAYDGVLGPEPAGLPAAVLAPEILATILKSAADVFALFRTDVEVKGVALTVEERAVLADLARAFGSKAQVIDPQTYFPTKYLTNPRAESPLVGKLNDLQRLWSRALDYLAKGETKTPEEQQKAATLKALNSQAEKLTAYLSTVDDKTGVSPLAALIKAEHLKQALQGAELLLVHIDVAGGSNKTTRNIWTGGSKLFHSGGVAVTVMVFDAAGTIAFSKAYRCAAVYTKFEDEPKTFIGNVTSR